MFLHALYTLTHEHQEMHAFILSTVATDDLVLKHQAISIHSTDKIQYTGLVPHTKYYIYDRQY